ncbi:hypothetical protein DPMN_080433 [Dreissena polymorpha]|uniref:Uncharacterized protein n=1 Tax=Dreissena polymorpha TaxID=45954 RepID=A0A9D4BRS2_DREPO|nr:hypothetical protein DPMN_080433 [Dreissena polymorpha]
MATVSHEAYLTEESEIADVSRLRGECNVTVVREIESIVIRLYTTRVELAPNFLPIR